MAPGSKVKPAVGSHPFLPNQRPLEITDFLVLREERRNVSWMDNECSLCPPFIAPGLTKLE